MSGGASSKTLEEGSEAVIDHECSQCKEDGLTKEATDVCLVCNEFLCHTCGKYHIRYMKAHRLASVVSTNQTDQMPPISSSCPILTKCHLHPDLDIEMYCGTHDMVYCCRCIAKEHRSCSDVKDIEEVTDEAHITTLQSLITNIVQVIEQLHDTMLKKSKTLEMIKMEKDKLVQDINAVRKHLNTHLDTLEQKIKAELDAKQTELEMEINADIKVAEDLIITTEKHKPDLDSPYDEKQLFIKEKLCRMVLVDAEKFLKKEDQEIHPVLKFEPNNSLCDCIKKSDQLGKIIRTDSESQRKHNRKYCVKSTWDINVRLTSDKKECRIADMCQLSDGTVLMIDCNNYKLKRLNDKLNVKDFYEFKSQPRGLCSVSSTDVAVRLCDRTIHLIQVRDSLLPKQTLQTSQSVVADYGMAFCRNQFWIPSGMAVYIGTSSGSLVKETKTDDRGRAVYTDRNSNYIAVSHDESKVFVTTFKDGVVVFNKNGDVVGEFHDQRLDASYGICVTDDDIVLVAGFRSKNIVMFDRDGETLGELVTSKDTSDKPRPLCYDRQRHHLLVGYYSDKVKIIELSK